MLFKKDELRHLLPFYVADFIAGFASMIWPFIVIYFLGIGFTFFEVALVLTIYSGSIFFFEVPTGAFADARSRKYSVLIGLLIAGLSFIAISLTTELWVILLLNVVAGFGMTFVSGANESLVIDNLNHFKRKDLHKEYFIKSHSIKGFAGVVAPLIGAWVVSQYSIWPLWWVWGGSLILSGVVILFFVREHYVPVQVTSAELVRKTIESSKKGLAYSKKHRTIWYLLWASFFGGIMFVEIDYWQPYLIAMGMEVWALGIVYTVFAAFNMVVPYIARMFREEQYKSVLIWLVVIRMVFLLSILFIAPGLFLLGAAALVVGNGIYNMHVPIVSPYFQARVPKKIRATVTSLKSMAGQSGILLGTITMGYFADIIGARNAIVVIALTGLLIIASYNAIQE